MSGATEPLEVLLSRVLLSPERAMRMTVPGRTRAGVLVALYSLDGELHTVLTERRGDLPRHAGEISFPGGRHEPDERDLLATALREAEEEIGLPPEAVEIAGALRPTPTIATSYAIYPFVGVIQPGTRWRLQPREVERVIELPLRAVRAGHDRRHLIRRGVAILTDVYAVGDAVIWGATARILADLLARLLPICP